MVARTALAALLLTACSGDPPKGVDAAAGDGPAAGAFGAACVTASDTSSECASGVCTSSIDTLGHPVCSQKCTTLGGTDPACPAGSMGQKCNMKGYCRP